VNKINSLSQQLRNHSVDDHLRGCPSWRAKCDCGYDDGTERLLRAAAARIDELEKRKE